jgi:hypothetical protein
MSRVHWNEWASLDLPSGWVHEDAPDLISIFREAGGVGAIQMSFARRKRPGDPTTEEAIELARQFAEQRGWNLGRREVARAEIDSSPTAVFSYTNDDSFWKVWHILDPERAAFLTYVSSSGDADEEAAEREAIVKSFVWDRSTKPSSTPVH